MDDYIHASIYEFKTHLSRYIRELESGEYKAVAVKRHGKMIGMFLLSDYLLQKAEARQKADKQKG